MAQPQHAITWVDSEATLAKLCQAWHQCPLLAMDTEFIRTNSYYPIPALIQVFDGEQNYLIDPQKITDWGELSALMVDQSVTKAFHSCSEDLEVFDHLLGQIPQPVLDTQIAAAFCGYGFSVGYANLVKTVLEIELPKGETRSDWLQRPLSAAQRDYAALDVEFLYTLAERLQQQLQSAQRMAWVSHECAQLEAGFRDMQAPRNAVLRFKNAWRLPQQNLAVLTELAAWREQEAQKRNRPRNHIIKERALFEVAERMPQQVGELRRIRELSERAIRVYGQALIDCVKTVAQVAAEELPQPMPRPLTARQNKRAKTLRDAVQTMAEQLQIAPEMLARKKDFEYIVRALERGAQGLRALPPHFGDWRAQLLLEALEQDQVEL